MYLTIRNNDLNSKIFLLLQNKKKSSPDHLSSNSLLIKRNGNNVNKPNIDVQFRKTVCSED